MKARLLVQEIRGSDDFFVGGQVVPGSGVPPCKEKIGRQKPVGSQLKTFHNESCSTAMPNLAAQLKFKNVLIGTFYYRSQFFNLHQRPQRRHWSLDYVVGSIEYLLQLTKERALINHNNMDKIIKVLLLVLATICLSSKGAQIKKTTYVSAACIIPPSKQWY
jgi:hypothetical protein